MEKVSDHIRALFYDLCPPKPPLPVYSRAQITHQYAHDDDVGTLTLKFEH